MSTFPTIETLSEKGKVFIGLAEVITGTHLVKFDATQLIGQMVIASQKSAGLLDEEVAQAIAIGKHRGKELSVKTNIVSQIEKVLFKSQT